MAKVSDQERRQLDQETNERVKLDGEKVTMMNRVRTTLPMEISKADNAFKAECTKFESQLAAEKRQIEARAKALSDQMRVLATESQRLETGKRTITGGGDLGDIERELNVEREKVTQMCAAMKDSLSEPVNKSIDLLQRTIEEAVNFVGGRSQRKVQTASQYSSAGFTHNNLKMKLMVGNLPADCEEKALHAVFAEHGECTVVIQPSADGQDPKAVVTYDNESCAKTAVSNLHHTQFGGKEIVVEEVAEVAEMAEASASSPPKPAAASRSRSRSRSPEVHATPSKPVESPNIKTPGSAAGKHEPEVQSSSSKKAKTEAPEPQASSHSTPAKVAEEPPAPEEPTAAASSDPKSDEKPKKKQSAKQEFAVEEDGSKFKILSTNKRNDELSSWKCLACNRKIQKKSVKAHIASKTHKQHIS